MAAIWAHRGANMLAPENTMRAFELAFELGADGIELDVQLSADGDLVVIHDETIDRTSNSSGQVVKLTTAKLRSLDFGCGQTIPLLAEVLEIIRGTNRVINIELKDSIQPYPEMADKTLKLIREFKIVEQSWISSFNHQTIADIAGRGVRTGLLTSRLMLTPIKAAKTHGASALHLDERLLRLPASARFIDRAHEAGIAIHPWTVDEPKRITALANTDAIITDLPDLARALTVS